MSRERTKSTVGDGEDSIVPSCTESSTGVASPSHVYFQMESLTEKLKLLNYERNFCRTTETELPYDSANGQRQISRHYFAFPTNPGEQFNIFTSLASWLINLANISVSGDLPQAFDDPNANIGSILQALRLLGHQVDFAPAKLKRGCGEGCVMILNILADSALIAQGHCQFNPPNYPKETDETEDDPIEDEVDEDEDEVLFAEWKDEEDDCGHINLTDDEDELDFGTLKKYHTMTKPRSSPTMSSPKPSKPSLFGPKSQNHTPEQDQSNAHQTEGILDSKSTPGDWQLEVERVLPHLRITVRQDVKDWRARLGEMHRHETEIASLCPEIASDLRRKWKDLSAFLDKIMSRERYINSQVGSRLAEYKIAHENLEKAKSLYQQSYSRLSERNRQLADLADDLKKVKAEMDSHGSKMTDSSPVVRIKQAIIQLQKEIVAMDIRIGVLEHTLLRAQLRQREDGQKSFYTGGREG